MPASAPERHPWFSPERPRVLAHRGLARPGDPFAENSMAAVVAALSAGASYIESDCHLTRDGEVVLFHDDSVQRVTGDPRLVADLTVAELARLMAEHGGLLTLRDALEGFPDVRWNLDVKATAAADPVGRLVAAHTHRVLLTSFSDSRRRAAVAATEAAGAVGRPATSAGTGTLVRVLLAALIGAQPLVARALRGVDALQIPERKGAIRVLSPRLLRAAHRCRVEVHVWTVNEPADMRRLLAMGVDGLVTDRADAALEIAREIPA